MADAYTFEGLKWGTTSLGEPSGNITWSVDWSGLTNDTATQATYHTQLDYAFQQWEDAASVTFSEYTGTGSPDVAISFGSIDGLGGTVALTSWTYSASGSSLYNPQDVGLKFDSSENWDPSTGSNLDFTTVALHEIGHVLGLDHTADDPSEIMYPTLTLDTTQETLGNGDIYGAQVLYGRDPTDPEIADPGGAAAPGTDVVAHSGGGGGGAGGGIIAALIGLLLALFGGGGGGAAAMAGAMKLDDGDNPDDTHDGHAGGAHPHALHVYDLADVIPITGTVSDEHPEDGHDDATDAGHHDLISLI